MSSEESNKMSRKTPSQDSNSEPKIKLSFDGCYNYNKLKEEGLVEGEKEESDLEKIWWEMEGIEPLTPLTDASLEAYREAAKSDGYMFGDYNAYEVYEE